MQSIRIAASRHDTSGKLVHDQHLIFLDHIILIPKHQIVSPQSQNNIMLNFQILRVGQIFNLEEPLHFADALSSQVHHLILLVYNKVAGLFTLHTHNGVHLGQLLHILAAGKLPCKNIAGLVQLCGLAALT